MKSELDIFLEDEENRRLFEQEKTALEITEKMCESEIEKIRLMNMRENNKQTFNEQ